jgi:hypothetical protein
MPWTTWRSSSVIRSVLLSRIQVLAQRAADAAVRHLDHLFLGVRERGIAVADQVGVDVHFAREGTGSGGGQLARVRTLPMKRPRKIPPNIGRGIRNK